MDISLLNILRTVSWDFRYDEAQSYANALKSAIGIHLPNVTNKQEGYFLSKKGTSTMKGNFQDKLWVGNIHTVERQLYWKDEELSDDDQIIDVVCIDGPVTRNGGGCSYGTKDYRDQVLYANTIPQVVGHIFIINTPGGETDCRKDYELMIADCRAKNKVTVAFVDGMCCSSGVNLASRCDRTIVMNPKDDYGCIGSMAAFWATPDGAVDQNGSRYVEIVGDESPEKNDWWREAAAGDYKKLRSVINKDTADFHDTVRKNRPLVEDSMLTGAIFEAQEVMPALVDEMGDMNRAVACVQDLATGKLSAARFAQKDEPDGTEEQHEDKPGGGVKAEHEPKEAPEAEPNEQPAPNPKINHKSNTNMTENKKQALQAAEQPEKTETEMPDKSVSKDSEVEPNEQETTPTEGPNEPSDDPDNNETPIEEPDGTDDPSESPEGEPNNGEEPDNNEEDPKEEGEGNNGPKGSEDGDNACGGGEPEKKSTTIKTVFAEQDKTIAEKDKEIINLKAQLSKTIKESNYAMLQMKKQIAELHKEVKELASEPTPMAEGTEAPKDNGTGVPVSGAVKSVVTADMSADEIRKRLREQDKAIAAKRRRL